MEKKDDICDFVDIVEGKATLKVPNEDGVFYNPIYTEELIRLRKREIGQMNRSTAALAVISPKPISSVIADRPLGDFAILESLAATGLRSFRYALEVDSAKHVIANDLSEFAVKTITYNSQLNNLTHKIITTQVDASQLMSQLTTPLSGRVEVIDLDPYGSVATFLDSAINAVADGGLLCVTSTDMATLCGNNVDACFYKYGAFSAKVPYCHEMALRIVLNCMESIACRYQRYVEPLMCLSVDFYVRLFVRVRTSAQEAKKSPLKRSHLLHCDNCLSFKLHRLGCVSKKDSVIPNRFPSDSELQCENCGSGMKTAGPIYSDPIFQPDFVQACINYNSSNSEKYKTSSRIHGMLTTLSEELTHSPFYYSIPECFSFIRCVVAPTARIMCDLIRNGKKVCRTHAKKNSIKTDATSEEFWDSIRAWARTESINTAGTNIRNPLARTLFDKPIKYNHNFEVDPQLLPKPTKKILRYQLNPTPYWGPLSKNTVGIHGQNRNSKRKIDD